MEKLYEFELIEKYITKRTNISSKKVTYIVQCDYIKNKSFETLEEVREFLKRRKLERYYEEITKTKTADLNTAELLMYIFELEDGYEVNSEIKISPESIEEHIEENFLWIIKKRLNEQCQKVMYERIINKRTLRAIGKLLNISQERVRQIEAKSIRKLKYMRGYLVLGEKINNYYKEIEDLERDLQRKVYSIKINIEKLQKQELTEEEVKEIVKKDFNMPIEELDLSVRSYNCLKRSGMQTIRDLIETSDEQLIRIRNMGRKSFKEIKEKLEKYTQEIKGE